MLSTMLSRTLLSDLPARANKRVSGSSSPLPLSSRFFFGLAPTAMDAIFMQGLSGWESHCFETTSTFARAVSETAARSSSSFLGILPELQRSSKTRTYPGIYLDFAPSRMFSSTTTCARQLHHSCQQATLPHHLPTSNVRHSLLHLLTSNPLHLPTHACYTWSFFRHHIYLPFFGLAQRRRCCYISGR